MSHISFSALKIWKECAHKYKLNYIDGKKRFTGNEYTIFGTALHEACERKLLDVSVDEVQIFKDKFAEELAKLPPDYVKNEKLIKEVSAEEELLQNIPNSEFQFKGYVDLIIQTDDGIYHILDYKTCSWGWDLEKKSDPMTNYQLTLYKHFFGNIKTIDPKEIETHFVLLKRTAKKNQVEVFRVTSGPKKVQNALKILDTAVHNINKGNFPKNRLNCKYCEFYQTEECQ